MIRGGHFWVGLSTDRACVVVRTYMFNVNTSEPYAHLVLELHDTVKIIAFIKKLFNFDVFASLITTNFIVK